MKEKDELYAMKVSQLGLKPTESNTIEGASESGEEGEEELPEDASSTRFPKLTVIDEKFKDYKIVNYNNSFTLEEFCDEFRNFCASELKLYYPIGLIRLFIAALSSTKLVILQGISGTGKTRFNSCFSSTFMA